MSSHHHHHRHNILLPAIDPEEIKPPKKYSEADLVAYALNAAEDINSCKEPSTYSNAINSNHSSRWMIAIPEDWSHFIRKPFINLVLASTLISINSPNTIQCLITLFCLSIAFFSSFINHLPPLFPLSIAPVSFPFHLHHPSSFQILFFNLIILLHLSLQ